MTDKQQRFVAEYLIDCNATAAAIRSGYSKRTAYAQGARLLKNAEVSAAIKAAMNAKTQELIATRAQRLAFWTQTMLDSDTDMKHRLKASELLARSEGDFTERHIAEVTQHMSCYDLSKLTESELLQLRETLARCKH